MAKAKNLEVQVEVIPQNAPVVAHQSDDLAGQLTALGASPGLIKRVLKASSNFALMESPKIPRIKALSDGVVFDAADLEEAPKKDFQGVILYGAKQKAFYEKDFDPAVKQPPDCFSHDGKKPDSSAAKPQSTLCKGCKQNQFETAKMGKGKACRDLRRLFFLLSVTPGEESVMPIQFNVTPTSLKNFDDYLSKLVTYGMSIEEVVTKVTGSKKTRDDKYLTFSFQKVSSFNEEKEEDKKIITNVKALKTAWLPYMERAEISGEDLEEEGNPAPAASEGPKGDF